MATTPIKGLPIPDYSDTTWTDMATLAVGLESAAAEIPSLQQVVQATGGGDITPPVALVGVDSANQVGYYRGLSTLEAKVGVEQTMVSGELDIATGQLAGADADSYGFVQTSRIPIYGGHGANNAMREKSIFPEEIVFANIRSADDTAAPVDYPVGNGFTGLELPSAFLGSPEAYRMFTGYSGVFSRSSGLAGDRWGRHFLCYRATDNTKHLQSYHEPGRWYFDQAAIDWTNTPGNPLGASSFTLDVENLEASGGEGHFPYAGYQRLTLRDLHGVEYVCVVTVGETGSTSEGWVLTSGSISLPCAVDPAKYSTAYATAKVTPGLYTILLELYVSDPDLPLEIVHELPQFPPSVGLSHGVYCFGKIQDFAGGGGTDVDLFIGGNGAGGYSLSALNAWPIAMVQGVYLNVRVPIGY